MTASPITAIRTGTAFTHSTAAVVITTFLALILSPTAAAAREVIENPTKLTGKPAPAAPQKDRLNGTLKLVRTALQRADTDLNRGLAATADIASLAALKAELIEADKEVLEGFDRDLAHIEKHKLQKVIKERHAKALADYKAKHAQMMGHLSGIASAIDPAAKKAKVKAAKRWLEGQQIEPKAAPFDPNKLGFMVETKKARAPKLTEEELKAVLPAPVTPLKTSALFSPLPLGEVGAHRAPGEGVFTDSAEPIHVASAGSMSGLIAMSAVTPPGPEYLAPTIDVQITPDIQALAAQLNHSPVEIYNYVRNTVDWIPTYGSVQGSQLTLDKKAGNAFDTSSLLIALLRASNIPARYVYGTIRVPIDQAMNWAGGFTSPDAMQTFLATGGIPNNALTQGGVSKFLVMEHVWVEAFVDFHPSRGAKNQSPDTWVPMDASFKQYQYTDGLDLEGQVPFDAEDFLTAAQEGATVNEEEGWVQNLNQANIEDRLNAYQQDLEAFIDNQDPDATVGDVLGAKAITQISAPVLASSLPYKLIATGARYADLPGNLRHKFRYSLYQDSHQRAIDNPLWTFEEATPNLASKKITLSFVPASDADFEAFRSYLPEPHTDGTPVQPEEFRDSIPAYNIKVKTQLRVEGETVAEGGAFSLGAELLGEGGFTYLHNLGDWDLTQEKHMAGRISAIGISLQGLSATQLNSLADDIADARTKLLANNVGELTVDQISGAFFTSLIWGYFASMESHAQLARQTGQAEHTGLSYGLAQPSVDAEYRYGVAWHVRWLGVLLDVGHQRRIAFSLSNDHDSWGRYNFLRGYHSSQLEHALLESVFTDPSDGTTPQAASAAKLITAAAQDGQKIYTITADNRAAVEGLQQSDEVKKTVRSALDAGRIVTIHQSPVQLAGFNGAGYIILDPVTGAGSYLIEGGVNGGSVEVLEVLKGLALLGFFAICFLLAKAMIVFVAAWMAGALLATSIMLAAINVLLVAGYFIQAILTGSSTMCRIVLGLLYTFVMDLVANVIGSAEKSAGIVAQLFGFGGGFFLPTETCDGPGFPN